MSIQCAMQVLSLSPLVLTKHKYSSKQANTLLTEVKNRMQTQYPQLVNINDNEPLAGAKMYLSEILRKYNTNYESINPSEILLNVKEVSSKRNVDTLAVRIKESLNNIDFTEQRVIIYRIR